MDTSVFLFVTFITLANSEDMRDLNINDLIHLAYDVSQVRANDVRPDEVTFYLLTRNGSRLITQENLNDIDVNLPTKILVHGWLENHRRSWYQQFTTEYLKYADVNIIQVDWEGPARVSYIYSARSTKIVGRYLAKFIVDAHLPTNLVHILGHSLGSHVAGSAGKYVKTLTGQQLYRITALDPAGPYFRNPSIGVDERLNKDDAEIVDAIHTDAGFYGYELPIGTLDVFVNGGTRIQPGCLNNIQITSIGALIQDSFCSHQRSCFYFIESINGGKFHCKKCQSWMNYERGLCQFQPVYTFGAEDVTRDMTGVCFASTNAQKPFLSKRNK